VNADPKATQPKGALAQSTPYNNGCELSRGEMNRGHRENQSQASGNADRKSGKR
jgi:hypothetical protein